MSDTKTVIVDCPSCGHAMGWTKGETLRPGDVCDICEATQDKDLRIADLERQLSEARAERDAFRASRDRLLDQRDEDVAKVVDQWKRRTEAAESRVSVLEGALGKVIAEVDFKLSGGDNPVERCGECGEYGAGMLRDVVNAARDALSNKLPTGTTPDAGGSTGEVIAGSADPQRTAASQCGCQCHDKVYGCNAPADDHGSCCLDSGYQESVPASQEPERGTRTCPDCDYALRPTHNGTDSMRCPECNVEYPPAPSTDGKEEA